MNAAASDNDATLNLTTTRDNLIASVKLAAEVLRRPVFPETEFEQLRQASLGRVENNRHRLHRYVQPGCRA